MSEPSVKECSLNPEATPFINIELYCPADRVCWPGSVSFPTPATASMMAKSLQPV